MLAARVLDEDAAHGLGRGCEEVIAAVPVRFLVAADQAQVSLMDQRSGIERLPGRLVSQLPRGQAAQVVVDQRQELRRSVRVTGRDGLQKLVDVRHLG
jgi:hypothetical protein